MYSNKVNVNILTALLAEQGIHHAVVCPGSRNAPIAHNLNECPSFHCHAVTDERSAGFFALGLALALNEPVVVCVTSGSALLNVMPAIAEAHYQQVPLIVVSADRPAQWIDQLDGQTLPQPGVFGSLVARSVSLPEPRSDEEHWYCTRLVNEALLCLPACIHINVPISEPLFVFDTLALPAERLVRRIIPATDYDCLPPSFIDAVATAKRPMIVFGQGSPHDFTGQGTDYLFSHVIVLHESLSPIPSVSHFDEVLALMATDDELASCMQPDVIVYVGGTVVSKRLKHFLRQDTDCQVWRINSFGQLEDTFFHLHGIVMGDPEAILQSLSYKLSKRHRNEAAMAYRKRWLQLLTAARQHAQLFKPPFSQLDAVSLFEQELDSLERDAFAVHYANSSAIRLANIYACHHVWCNRGINGIEGSLSTAAGFSRAMAFLPSLSGQGGLKKVFCVIGDLSFFYDANALWNVRLEGNLRILLLNNGGGGIFNMLPGLEKSSAKTTLVSATHQATAQGICLQNDIVYVPVTRSDELLPALKRLVAEDAARPMLVEVFTDPETDATALKEFYGKFTST